MNTFTANVSVIAGVGLALLARSADFLETLSTELRRRGTEILSIPIDIGVADQVAGGSGKYWKPGSRYYGKTKKGEYMSEEEAIQKGYRPANGTGE
jgi:hypothetical protein